MFHLKLHYYSTGSNLFSEFICPGVIVSCDLLDSLITWCSIWFLLLQVLIVLNSKYVLHLMIFHKRCHICKYFTLIFTPFYHMSTFRAHMTTSRFAAAHRCSVRCAGGICIPPPLTHLTIQSDYKVHIVIFGNFKSELYSIFWKNIEKQYLCIFKNI